MTHIRWANEVSRDATEEVGGKAANLAEMTSVGLPVPPAFFVTSGAFQAFVDEAGLAEKIETVVADLDPEDNDALNNASKRVRELVETASVPEGLAATIRDAYEDLGGEGAEVAIRSSATAEDLPEASFAGQQDTYLHVDGVDDVIDLVQKCWASLYTPRAIYYREKNGFPHAKVRMAVVVQQMVDPDAAGVMFTRHPSSGADEVIVEAAWGLGEGVVSGRVSPDNYVLDRDGQLVSSTIATKKTQIVRGPDGRTKEQDVPEARRDEQVLDDAQLDQLAGLARTLEDHYGGPQDVEWAFADGQMFVLQTRPITTIEETQRMQSIDEDEAGDVLIEGLGAGPGIGTGPVAWLDSADELEHVDEDDVLVTTMTTPDMVPAMRRASAIVTDEGGMTCHAAIVSRELGVPCVVGTKKGTQVLEEDQPVTVDGDKGTVRSGIETQEAETETFPQAPTVQAAPETTATEVKVNVSMPEATERAVQTQPDGVGLLRVEHIVLGLGEHPMEVIEDGRADEFVNYLADGIQGVAEAFHPRPVWMRTLDAPTDEFRQLPGGDREPHEANPMLGWRGIRRDLDQPRLLEAQFRALKRVREAGNDNVGVMLPLVQHPGELRRAKQIAREAGLDPDGDLDLGVMIETPASALIVEDLITEGLDFVSFGTNDLTQYTLAVDRNNENVAELFDEFHPGLAKLIERVIDVCNEHDVESSICGQAGSDPDFAAKLVEWGISSISANIDAVDRVRRTVAREEKRMLLDQARDG
jgi:pyruvate,water dikinase